MTHQYTENKTISLGNSLIESPSETEESYTPLDIRNTVTDDGNIPADVISYRITNLGPLGDGKNLNTMTVNGKVIPIVMQFVGGSNENKYESIPYICNGNTLFIEYTIIT